MVFAYPSALLLFVPFAFCAYRIFRRSGSGRLPIFPGAGRIAAKRTFRQSMVPPVLLLLGMALIIVAAARPQTRFSQSRRTADAIAIEMAIDISGSMGSLDFADRLHPSRTRLDVVKETFSEFVSRRPDDMIGIIAFGGYATTRAPLTTDHDALVEMLDAVYIPGAKRDEIVSREETLTALGDGLAMACARLNAETNIASRIVILLSDGVSNYGLVQPEQARALAQKLGIRVYTIGIGSQENTSPADIFGAGLFGMPAGPQIDEEGLRKIAESTGGRYFNVKSKSEMEKALEEIDKLQKTRIDELVYRRVTEHYSGFLGAGLLFALAGMLFPVQIGKGVA